MEHKNDRLPIFTERFRELQGERSNTEFADFLGISRQTVGFYCNGDRIPDALTLIKIAQKCGVSADWLLGLSKTKALDGELKQVCKYTGLSEQSVTCLNNSKYKGQEFDLRTGIVDSILAAGYINRYCRYAWLYVMAEMQKQNNLSARTEKDVEELRKLEDNIADNVLDANTTSFITKISVFDAVRYYENAAIRQIKRATESALNKYLKAMMTYKDEHEKQANSPNDS